MPPGQSSGVPFSDPTTLDFRNHLAKENPGQSSTCPGPEGNQYVCGTGSFLFSADSLKHFVSPQT